MKETTGVATSIKKSLRTIQRIAYMAVEDTIQLMERLYVTEMGQTAFDHLKPLQFTADSVGSMKPNDPDRYDDESSIDRLFLRYEDMINALNDPGLASFAGSACG